MCCEEFDMKFVIRCLDGTNDHNWKLDTIHYIHCGAAGFFVPIYKTRKKKYLLKYISLVDFFTWINCSSKKQKDFIEKLIKIT